MDIEDILGNIKKIVISHGIEEIAMTAFSSGAITEVVIPSTVKHIAYGVFSGSEDCLKTIYYTGSLEEWRRIDNQSSDILTEDKVQPNYKQ